MALGHLGGGHLRVRAVGEHEEQIRVERPLDALAHVLDVGQEVGQVEVDLERAADAAVRPVHIHIADAARQGFQVAALHAGGHLQRGLGLVVDALRLAQLLVLQLLDVTQGFHAGRVAVNVAAGRGPAGAQRGKFLVARFAQVLAGVGARLEIDRLPRHVARVALRGVAVAARLDGVEDANRCVQVAPVEEVAHRIGDVVLPELGHRLGDADFEFPIQRIDVPEVVGREGVLAHGQRVAVNHALEVGHHDAGPTAEGAKFLVAGVQRPVGVRLGENHLHQARDIGQPRLDGGRLVQFGNRRGEAEPGARRAGHAGHQAGGENAQRARAGAVVDRVMPLVALVAVGDEESPRARQQVLADFAPVGNPA